jgi:hypothetical protein
MRLQKEVVVPDEKSMPNTRKYKSRHSAPLFRRPLVANQPQPVICINIPVIYLLSRIRRRFTFPWVNVFK